jgi:hypothetical protein
MVNWINADIILYLLAAEVYMAAESATSPQETINKGKYPFLELSLLIFCS